MMLSSYNWIPSKFLNNLPPQFSILYKLWNLCDAYGAIFFKSYVLTRVANRDWWASRKVVSINNSPLCSRTFLANAVGPSCFRISLQPGGGALATKLCKSKMHFFYKIAKFKLSKYHPVVIVYTNVVYKVN